MVRPTPESRMRGPMTSMRSIRRDHAADGHILRLDAAPAPPGGIPGLARGKPAGGIQSLRLVDQAPVVAVDFS